VLRMPDVNRMPEIERQLATADDATAFTLRDEWMQLQVVRALMPICALCEKGVGPVYLEVGGETQPPALCLSCFDLWACDHDPASDRLPPSRSLQVMAQEAREREADRRQGQEPAPARPCWHCGGSVDDPEPSRVMLKAAALVPNSTTPEVGEICLPCLDHDLGLGKRWARIERDLCDPQRLRHERAPHRCASRAAPPPAHLNQPTLRPAGRRR
jgi:hypothetical protein